MEERVSEELKVNKKRQTAYSRAPQYNKDRLKSQPKGEKNSKRSTRLKRAPKYYL